MEDDQELYRVLEDVNIFNRTYKAGRVLWASDIENWAVPEKDSEAEIGRLRAHGLLVEIGSPDDPEEQEDEKEDSEKKKPAAKRASHHATHRRAPKHDDEEK